MDARVAANHLPAHRRASTKKNCPAKIANSSETDRSAMRGGVKAVYLVREGGGQWGQHKGWESLLKKRKESPCLGKAVGGGW